MILKITCLIFHNDNVDTFTKMKVQSIYYVLVRHQTYLKGGTTNETSDTCYFRNWGITNGFIKTTGKEVENLTPDYLQQLLFDDIPYLPIIQKSMIILHKRYAIGVLKFFI